MRQPPPFRPNRHLIGYMEAGQSACCTTGCPICVPPRFESCDCPFCTPAVMATTTTTNTYAAAHYYGSPSVRDAAETLVLTVGLSLGQFVRLLLARLKSRLR